MVATDRGSVCLDVQSCIVMLSSLQRSRDGLAPERGRRCPRVSNRSRFSCPNWSGRQRASLQPFSPLPLSPPPEGEAHKSEPAAASIVRGLCPGRRSASSAHPAEPPRTCAALGPAPPASLLYLCVWPAAALESSAAPLREAALPLERNLAAQIVVVRNWPTERVPSLESASPRIGVCRSHPHRQRPAWLPEPQSPTARRVPSRRQARPLDRRLVTGTTTL